MGLTDLVQFLYLPGSGRSQFPGTWRSPTVRRTAFPERRNQSLVGKSSCGMQDPPIELDSGAAPREVVSQLEGELGPGRLL